MSFLARVSYTADGSTDTFSFSFPYILSSHVKVYVDGTEDTGVTFPTTSTVQLSSTPANGAVVLIQRTTPSDARLTDFQDGSVLTSADLDQSADQNFYLSQETSDNVASKLSLDASDRFDAINKRIINVANPVDNNDAVNKTYLENTWLSTTDKATLNNVNSNITAINTVNSNISAITTTNSNATNINTVATNIGSVNTVATDITKVIAVANDLAEAVSEVETVADDLNEATSEIDTVATNIANVNTVGTAIANVNTVAGLSSAIGTVNSNSANINTVAGNNTNINTVATANSNITTLAGINANITTVAGISANVTTVAGLSSAIGTVNSNSSNINTVAGAITNINNVGGSIANVNTVATNLAGVNAFGERYRVQSGTPTSNNDIGDLVFDTASNTMKVFSSGGFINAGSSVNGTANRFEYTATAGQTTFTGSDSNSNTMAYDAGFIDCYLNGVKLANADFTATNGTSVILATGASVNDILMVVAFGTFSLSNFSITDANDVPVLGSAGQALVVNQAGNSLEFSNASSAEVYGFEKYYNPSTLVKTVTDSGGKYYIDGVQQDTLELYEGNTYIFNHPSSHPFRFSTDSNNSNAYTTGVTVNSSTQVTIVVASDTPTLYYYCSSHSGMGGQANTPTPANNAVQYITTNQGQDNITESQYANFDDVLFSASGFVFSINTNGNLISTI
jgi:hypothetical protein